MPDILVVKCNAFLPSERLQAILDNLRAQKETGYGYLALCGDTYVECEYRHRCKAIYEHLEKEKNK